LKRLNWVGCVTVVALLLAVGADALAAAQTPTSYTCHNNMTGSLSDGVIITIDQDKMSVRFAGTSGIYRDFPDALMGEGTLSQVTGIELSMPFSACKVASDGRMFDCHATGESVLVTFNQSGNGEDVEVPLDDLAVLAVPVANAGGSQDEIRFIVAARRDNSAQRAYWDSKTYSMMHCSSR
jgi:hypothetical protein